MCIQNHSPSDNAVFFEIENYVSEVFFLVLPSGYAFLLIEWQIEMIFDRDMSPFYIYLFIIYYFIIAFLVVFYHKEFC